MSVAPKSVVIACPHCGTRYRVPPETIGPRGRKVACAHCGEAWTAEPQAMLAADEPDQLFSEADEKRLDDAFTAAERAAHPALPPPRPNGLSAALQKLLGDGEVPPEVRRSIEEIRAAVAPHTREATAELLPPAAPAPDESATPPPEVTISQRQLARAFARRRRLLDSRLPTSRIRRAARIAGVSLLLLLVVGAVAFRTDVVRVAPALAGVYSGLGLGVNVVGLDFSDVSTLISRRDGQQTIGVEATIHSVETHPVAVPPVVVTLLDGAGHPLYEWSVQPEARDLRPGEVLSFSTELPAPPLGTSSVRLSFADGRSSGAVPVTMQLTTNDKDH